MSQIIKAYTGVFLVLFLMATGVGILGAFLQTMQAQDLHGKIIDELENSDYAVGVLKETYEITENYGLNLEVLLYLENGECLHCGNRMEVPDTLEQVTMAEVAVTYPIRIAFWGIEKEHRLTGYAR